MFKRAINTGVLLALLSLLVFTSLPQAETAISEETAASKETVASSDTDAKADRSPGAIHYVKVDGVVNPVMSEYLIKSMKNAADDGAEMVVIQLDTPGGLDLSMRDIIKAMLASEVPVVVYVGPSGARAASAGVFMLYASHVAAMAPGTNTGSAHPVAMGGGGGGDKEADETMMQKVENDAVAYIKSIAKKKGRNAEWAEKAVRESVNVTAEEALKLGVIEIIAEGRAELMEALNGRTVETVIGERKLKTAGAEIKEVEMNMRFRILKAIANPNVAYVLMMIGMIGIYFELSNPGAILPGVVGAICLILAFYAFQTLSVNYAGIALIGLAAVFFIAEIKVTSFGLLSLAGVVSLLLGSLMLFDSPLPFMRLSLSVLLPTVLIVSAFCIGAMMLAIRIYRRTPVSGMEGFVGREGEATSDVGPEGGKVYLSGEYWNATSDEAIKEGDKIKVVEIKGLNIKVVRL
ncbi:MAG: nodulation protein NfeD [Thermodesulfobacteriota bacterium]